MKFTSEKNPAFSVNALTIQSLAHALEDERTKFIKEIPTGTYRDENGNGVKVGWKNNCFQVNYSAA